MLYTIKCSMTIFYLYPNNSYTIINTHSKHQDELTMKKILATGVILLTLLGCNNSEPKKTETNENSTTNNLVTATDNVKETAVIVAKKAEKGAEDITVKVTDKTVETWDKSKETTTEIKDNLTNKTTEVWDKSKKAATDAKNETDEFIKTESEKLKNETQALKQKAEENL